MRTTKKLFFLGTLCLLFVFSAAIGFLWNEVSENHFSYSEQTVRSAEVQPQKPRKFCWEESYLLCRRYELDCENTVLEGNTEEEEQLQDLSLQEIAARYPLPEWQVQEVDRTVTLCRQQPGLCAVHKKIYHFGMNENGQYLAVYYGPAAVGNSAGAFLITDIAVERLSAEQIAEIKAGMYEYMSQEELISMLDNFSEL